MSKFLSFETTNNGTVLFPIVDGCFMNISSPEALAITNGTITVFFAGTNMSQSLIDSINSAQVEAFQSPWTQAVSVVSIPFGTTIDSVSAEEGGGDAGPGDPSCEYQITVSPAAANPVNIIYYTGGLENSITVAIGDNAILNNADCFPVPAIDPFQTPAPNPANVTIVDITP
jgi:hypothetical protein